MSLDLEPRMGTTGAPALDHVEAGARGAGEYRCLDCGYGIVTFALVPACPMCRGARWAVTSHGPFSARERVSAED